MTAVAQVAPAAALIPLDAVERMAAAMAKSGLFGMKTPDQALALMLVAQAEGQHPATIAQDYDIIQGRAARKTHSVLARFQASGGRVEWHELTDVIAEATFSHPAGGSLRISWTIAQAKAAGLTGKDNWKNYPRAMLRARCIAEGVRAVFPGAIGGLLVAEEAQDLPRVALAPEVASDPLPELDVDLLRRAEVAAGRGVESYGAFWKSLTKEQRQTLRDEHARLKAAAEQADRMERPAVAGAVIDAATGEVMQ